MMVARVRKRFVYASINSEMAGNNRAGVVREISMRRLYLAQAPTETKTAGSSPAVLFYAFKSSGLIGICRIRFPVAAKTAFATAGAMGGTPISPMPEGL